MNVSKIAACLFFVSVVVCVAGQGGKFTYQGKLVQGSNLVNDTVAMKLRIYTNDIGGAFVYEETNLVVVADGYYSFLVGKQPNYGQLKNAVKANNAHIEIEVNGQTLSPRESFAPPPFAMQATDHWRTFTLRDYHEITNAQNVVEIFSQHPTVGSWRRNETYREAILFPPAWEMTEIEKISFFKAYEDIVEAPTCNLEHYLWGEIRDYSGSVVRTITSSNTLIKGLPVGQWIELPLGTNVVLQPGELLVIYAWEERARDVLSPEGSYATGLYWDVQVQ